MSRKPPIIRTLSPTNKKKLKLNIKITRDKKLKDNNKIMKISMNTMNFSNTVKNSENLRKDKTYISTLISPFKNLFSGPRKILLILNMNLALVVQLKISLHVFLVEEKARYMIEWKGKKLDVNIVLEKGSKMNV